MALSTKVVALGGDGNHSMKLKDFEVRDLPLKLPPVITLALCPRGLSICPVKLIDRPFIVLTETKLIPHTCGRRTMDTSENMRRGGRSSASSTAFTSMGLNVLSTTMRGMSCTSVMIASIKCLRSSIGSVHHTLMMMPFKVSIALCEGAATHDAEASGCSI
jgi:hypothetical protein